MIPFLITKDVEQKKSYTYFDNGFQRCACMGGWRIKYETRTFFLTKFLTLEKFTVVFFQTKDEILSTLPLNLWAQFLKNINLT